MFAGFAGFTEFLVNTHSTPDVLIHGVQGGSGPAILLVHGFPQTYHIWHSIAPKLITHFTVVAVDLRGYGGSTKLRRSQGHVNYAKSAMARDLKIVMENLGHQEFYICAHDRGARVAHKLCVDYPTMVKKAIFLDIAPTLAMYSKTDFEFAKAYFHWFFLIQKYPMPETMISQNPKAFAQMFMGGRHAGLDAFTPENFAEYVSVLEDPGAVEAMCEEYRASSTIDMEESRGDIASKKFIQNPLLVLWGKHGVVGKLFDAIGEWKAVSSSNVEGAALDCGHYIPEEAPTIVVEYIKTYFI